MGGAIDKSSGYEAIAAEHLQSRRNIGAEVVREWASELTSGAAILDIGCGGGIPISQALIEDGFDVYGLDASPAMIAAFRQNFPEAPAECSAFEDSPFFHRSFDGIVAWGLMFLLQPETQRLLIGKAAGALMPGGKFLFTSPSQICSWPDAMTGLRSESLGIDAYREILSANGLSLTATRLDQGGNHYYFTSRA